MEKESFEQRVASLKLDDTTLQQTKEQLQRCRVELDALEQELDRNFCKQEQLRLYLKLKAELNNKQQRLYELNKKVASQSIIKQQLERFEDFEALHHIFQHIRVLETQLNTLNLQEQTLLVDKATAQARFDATQQQWTTACNQRDDAFRATTEAAHKMAEAAHHSERIQTATTNARQLDKILTEEEQCNDTLSQDRSNAKSLLEEAQQELQEVSEKLSVLHPHQQMLQHSESVLTKLDNLFYLFQRRTVLRQTLENTQKQQKQRNELLGSLYLEHQKLTDEINTLVSEVMGHQQSIAGQSSYTIQQNAITLHNRQQMLETALNTWLSIAAGYKNIEDKKESILVTNRKLEYQRQELNKIKATLHTQEKILEQKHEKWMLAKSQNSIQMRASLKEGEPCAVCGATAHPLYNSDMTGQATQVSVWKTDYETELREVEALRQHVKDLELELATLSGQLHQGQDDCQLLQQQQQQQVSSWKPFAQLDKALAYCSPGTDRNMRLLTLRTLVEQTTMAADEAQRELDTYSFHINAINVTNERINEMHRKESELIVRLNEENTACQVLGQQVEASRNRMDIVTREFSRVYEQLNTVITLQEWWQEWQVAPESIRLQIQQMSSNWDILKEKEKALTQRVELLSQHLSDTSASHQRLIHRLQFFKDTQQQFTDDIKEQQQMLNAITLEDEQVPFQLAMEQYNESIEALQCYTEEKEAAEKVLLQIEITLQLLHDQRESLAKQLSEAHTHIDVWMHQYNASHTPVRFEELQEVLSEDQNWNDVRKNLKSLEMQQLISQSEVDLLNTQIVALQIDSANGVAGNEEDRMMSLLSQQQRLTDQRSNLLQQMAQLNNKLHQQELLNNLNSSL